MAGVKFKQVAVCTFEFDKKWYFRVEIMLGQNQLFRADVYQLRWSADSSEPPSKEDVQSWVFLDDVEPVTGESAEMVEAELFQVLSVYAKVLARDRKQPIRRR